MKFVLRQIIPEHVHNENFMYTSYHWELYLAKEKESKQETPHYLQIKVGTSPSF